MCVSERQRKRERETKCVYIVIEANEILVPVTHDDQVPCCHPAHDTLSKECLAQPPSFLSVRKEDGGKREVDWKRMYDVCSY